MKYRLGFPLLIIAVIACIGIACAMGRNALPEKLLDTFNANAPSGGSADVADLSKRQPSSQGGRGSSGGSGEATTLPSEAFQEFFEVALADNLSDVTTSLTFPQDSEYNGAQSRGFVSASGYSSSSYDSSGFSGSLGSSGSSSSRGGRTGPVWVLGGSNGSGSGGSFGSGGGAGSGGSGGSGGSSGGNPNGQSQNQILASIIAGQKDSGSGGSTPNPVIVDDSGILPKVTDIPQTSYVPQQSNPAGGNNPGILPKITEIPPVTIVAKSDDPLLGVPLRDVVPGPEVRNPDPAPVPNPEPGTLILGGIGLAIMAVARRRMKSRQGE